MISADEFRSYKWKLNTAGDWSKLGVKVYKSGGFLVIKFRYADLSSCQFTRYTDWYSVTMGDLISIIKNTIMVTFAHKGYSKMYSPKYKRTLNNWILNDRA